jgi:hypothetical protein
MRRLIVLTLIAVFGIGVAACGLPTDDEFTRIDEADDGFGLSRPSTTTTTTTLAPTTTIDATTSTVIETTTTSIPVEPVDVYFPTGRQLAVVQLLTTPDPALDQVMALILDGPPDGEAFASLRSILPANAVVTATRANGVAVIDFPEGIFNDMEPRDQRLVCGQIVLTMTSQRGVGQVLFTQAGQPLSVFLGDASRTEPNQTVSAEDYSMLLTGGGDPIDTTTTTTTVTTSTTAPAIDPAITLLVDG